jgi:lactate permease
VARAVRPRIKRKDAASRRNYRLAWFLSRRKAAGLEDAQAAAAASDRLLTRELLVVYTQNYHPLASEALSTLVAALPVLVLFYLLVVQRALAPWAAAGGAAAALLIAVTVYRMPAVMAGLAFVNGALFGLLPICWTIVNAMLLYNLTVVTGRFERIKQSVAGLSADHRLQAVLIAFAFGAFLEGAAGGGTPVAICAAMLVGLGFDPFLAAGLCLIANTSPVAYGGFGTPILTLQSVTSLDAQKLSHMAGNQLPLLSCLIPIWLVRCMCGWRETMEVLPAIAVAGVSFAICQYLFAHSAAFPLTDIAGGLFSMVATGIFLRYWQPRQTWRFETHGRKATPAAQGAPIPSKRLTLADTVSAWMPFLLLCALMLLVGLSRKSIDAWSMGPMRGAYELHMPHLDQQVQRTPPVVEKVTREPAVFRLNWVTTPGTPIVVTALLLLPMLRVSRRQLLEATTLTARQMMIPVPTIVCMLGLGSVTRLGGLDATLGMAFKHTGLLYPFFAAVLGWLGVFLTGTDAASNALFGSLQKITALQLGLNPILIATANSTGGVMGKMIDAQSICVATAATERVGTEADIFRFVIRHSIALAAIMGIIVLLQAYLYPFTAMVPHG